MIEALTLITSRGPQLLASMTATDEGQLAMWLGGGLVALAMVADHVSAVWDRLRQKPPAGQVYATRAELREAHARIDNFLVTVKTSIDELKTELDDALKEVRQENGDINKSLTSIHRALGRLEGHTEGGNHHG